MAGDTQEPWAIVRAKLSLAKTNPIAESHHYSQSSPASGSKRKVFYENIPALTIPSCWLFSSKQQNRPSDSGQNRAEATKKKVAASFGKVENGITISLTSCFIDTMLAASPPHLQNGPGWPENRKFTIHCRTFRPTLAIVSSFSNSTL